MLYLYHKGSETKGQSNIKRVNVGAQSHGTRICRAGLPKSEMGIGGSVFFTGSPKQSKRKKKMRLRFERLKISFKKFLRSSPLVILFRLHGSQKLIPARNFTPVFFISIRKKRGQVIIEYFILFTIITALTIITTSTFFPSIQDTFSNIRDSAIERINSAGN